MFVGRFPHIKFNVTHESATKGRLGELIASPDIVKIVNRIDSNNVYSALKIFASSGYQPKNFFEVRSKSKIYCNYSIIY